HAGLVAEDRSAAARGRRVNRQHRDLVAATGEEAPENIDRGGLADAGRPGNADPHRLAGARQQLLHQCPRGLLMIGALALDQGNGAGEHRALAGANGTGKFAYIRRANQRATGGHDIVLDLHGRIANARAGKPSPSLTLGHVTTISAPVAGTLSRLVMTSI